MLDMKTKCMNYAEKLRKEGDDSGFKELPTKLEEINEFALELQIPLHSRFTLSCIHGISYNTAISKIRKRLQKNASEDDNSSKPLQCQAPCPGAVPPQAAAGNPRTVTAKPLTAGARGKQAIKQKADREMFDPFFNIMKHLNDKKSWKTQGSTMGWGVSLDQEADALAGVDYNSRAGSKRKRS